MSKSFPKLATIAIVAAAASQLGSTDCGQVIRDSGFDLWCGSSLCNWILETGSIAKVPTWNTGDPGVSLSDAAVIEQISPVSSADGNCIDFDVISNIDDGAEVDLFVDVYGDGIVHYMQPIPNSSWKPVTFQIPIQGNYDGIVFQLAKLGDGSAVLAEVGAQIGSDCGGLPPIVAGLGAGGVSCSSGANCTSGICFNDGDPLAPTVPSDYSCATCGACVDGTVCGLGDPTFPFLAVPVQCVPAAAGQLGEQCITDAECAIGICTSGMCSTCREDNTGCGSGQTCGPEWASPIGAVYYFGAPWTCNAHDHVQPHGAPCASNNDCASNTCHGSPRMQCDDGRACTSAADCPFGTSDTSNGLQNGPCSLVGIQGGSCE
jgi:hypothetical protein